MKKAFLNLIFILSLAPLFCQEALKSTQALYFELLSLQGNVERPYLNYRSLSDNVYDYSSNELWSNNKLQTEFVFFDRFDNSLKLKVYSFELFNSVNTNAPYGRYDGVLWQGRGYNASFTTGVKLECYGLSLTFKPQVAFSQNLEYEIMESAYESPYGYFWKYKNGSGRVDCPQRFGDKAFFDFSWGDTEVRYTWNSFTFGFGWQSVWLGCADVNPLFFSNNAPSFPKFDIGMKKQKVVIPGIDYYLGDIEARVFVGQLTESDYYDSDETNNHNMINLFTVSYAPSFLPGLVLGANKVCLSKWGDDFFKYLNPFYFDNGDEDQKVSVTAEFESTKGQLTCYTEVGIDDRANDVHDNINSLVTHFWHTMTFTFGMKKGFDFNENLKGLLVFEWNNTEMSQDMQVQWDYSFGFHHKITQGYTNRGQWLGSGIGYGGNSQYVGFDLYYQKGKSSVFIHRFNPDNNSLFRESIGTDEPGDLSDLHNRTWNYFRGELVLGISTEFFVLPNLNLGAGFVYDYIVNPLYNKYWEENKYSTKWNNVQFTFTVKYTL